MSTVVHTELKWAGDQYIVNMYKDMLQAYGHSADKIRNVAKSLVPVDSGDLKETIRARVSEKKYMALVFAGDRTKTTAAHPKKIFYAHMVEYGTYFEPAHPFMRPAADSNFNAVKAESTHAAQRSVNAKRRFTSDTRAKQIANALKRQRNFQGQFTS
tara:strand:- start:446 stop:916 length:471 start_codon:yes stop_codon:yes gene_type:complete